MSEMDNQGTLPSYVEPGRRQSPKARDAEGAFQPGEEAEGQEQAPPERPSPSEAPFEPSAEKRGAKAAQQHSEDER